MFWIYRIEQRAITNGREFKGGVNEKCNFGFGNYFCDLHTLDSVYYRHEIRRVQHGDAK